MNKLKKSLIAVLVGALSTCGVAVHAPAQEATEYRTVKDSTGQYTFRLYSDTDCYCSPQDGYRAEREDNSTGFREEGCWDLDDNHVQLVTWWPQSYDVIKLPWKNVEFKKNSDGDD